MEGECYITSFRDLNRISTCFRGKGEKLIHFLRTFHIELPALITHTVFIQNGLARLDAKQDIMRVSVFFIDIMTVIGTDERDASFSTHLHQCLIDDLLLAYTMILQFQKEIAFAKNSQIFQSRFLRLFVGNRQDISGHFPCQTGTGSNQPFAVFSQKFLIHTGFVIKPFREAIGN